MVHKETDTNLITLVDGLSSTTVFCMVAKNNILPPAVFHKLLALCISNWDIVKQNRRRLIFHEVCRFNLDHRRHYKLTVFATSYAVHARVISYTNDLKPTSDICKPVQEFFVQGIRKILRSMGFSSEFRTCIQCPKFSPLDNGGYLDLELMDNQTFITCDNCETSYVLEKVDFLGSWTAMPSVQPNLTKWCVKDDSSLGRGAPIDIIDKGIDVVVDAESEKGLCEPPITQKHLNHAGVCNALVTVCADVLRDILLSQIPPGYLNVYQFLLARKPALMAMKQFRF